METKSIFASKTIWINALTVLVVLAAFFGVTPDQALTEKLAAGLTAIVPLINIVLRLVTNKPVSL